MNFDQIVLKRGSSLIKDHVVVISLEKEQRTNFNDAMVQPDISEEKRLYLNGLKYRDMQKPYNDFLMYENLVLFAHQNILSTYDIIEKNFVQH